ncbi:MAG: TIR domain-containing protein [Verrucomicrobiales bacterium]|nr:TIR domain-containing protein [Verrucomicrobiales bacterium]
MSLLKCPKCEAALRLTPNLAGKTVKCGGCGSHLKLPDEIAPDAITPPPAPPEPEEEQPAEFTINCPNCDVTLEVGPEDVGIEAPCPACHVPFLVPGNPADEAKEDEPENEAAEPESEEESIVDEEEAPSIDEPEAESKDEAAEPESEEEEIEEEEEASPIEEAEDEAVEPESEEVHNKQEEAPPVTEPEPEAESEDEPDSLEPETEDIPDEPLPPGPDKEAGEDDPVSPQAFLPPEPETAPIPPGPEPKPKKMPSRKNILFQVTDPVPEKSFPGPVVPLSKPAADGTDVFISHDKRDLEYARIIAGYLRSEGKTVFLDESNPGEGEATEKTAEQAFAECRSVVFLPGPDKLGKTQQIEKLAAFALRSGAPGFPVVPVLLPNHSDSPMDLLPLDTWLDLRSDPRDQRSLARLKAALEGIDPVGVVEDPRDQISPYRGLRPFREEDATFYFGREREAAELVELVAGRSCSVVPVIGPEGIGKSSLVAAGLLPALRKGGWEILSLRPLAAPLLQLAEVLSPPSSDVSPAQQAADLNRAADLLRRREVTVPQLIEDILSENQDSSRVLIFVDQWEELYTQADNHIDESDPALFIESLLDAAETTACTVVFTVRTENCDPALAHPCLAGYFQNGYTLEPMGDEAILDCMIKPAEKAGYHFEPGLIDRIGFTAETGSELQHLLDELWQRRDGKTFTQEAYEAIVSIPEEASIPVFEELTAAPEAPVPPLPVSDLHEKVERSGGNRFQLILLGFVTTLCLAAIAGAVLGFVKSKKAKWALAEVETERQEAEEVIDEISVQIRDRVWDHLPVASKKTVLEPLRQYYSAGGEKVKRANPNSLIAHLQTSGDLKLEQGNFDAALDDFQKAHELAVGNAQSESASPEAVRSLLIACQKLGDFFLRKGQNEDALNYYRRALEASPRLADDYPDRTSRLQQLAVLEMNTGDLLLESGSVSAAIPHLQKAFSVCQELNDRAAENSDYLLDLRISSRKLGDACASLGENDKAIFHYEQDLHIVEKMLSLEPGNPEFEREFWSSCLRLGNFCRSINQIQSANRYFEAAFVQTRKMKQENRLSRADEDWLNENFPAWNPEPEPKKKQVKDFPLKSVEILPRLIGSGPGAIDIYFDFEPTGVKLTGDWNREQMIELSKAVGAIAKEGGSFAIENHSYDGRSSMENLQLSRKRAEVVVQSLVNMGVASSALQAVGKGSLFPKMDFKRSNPGRTVIVVNR